MNAIKLAGLALVVLMFVVPTTHRASAQTPNSQAPAQTPGSPQSGSPTSAQSASSQPAPAVRPKVVAILDGHLEADDLVKVEVQDLDKWAATPTNDPAKLVPFLNGLALLGNYPEEIHTSENHLHYHLRITSENKKVWTDLLGAPTGLRHPVTFSVGLEGQSPFDSVFHSKDKEVPLTVISPVYGIIALVLVLATLILLVWLARTTNLIREPGPKPAGGKLRPYNLGRTQMAFWFFLVYASYVAIWLITNALDTITASLLGLIGISAGTALSEAMIDSGKDSLKTGQLQDLTAEKQSLEQSIPELQSQISAVNAKATLAPEDVSNRDSLNKQTQDSRTRLAQVNQQIQALTPSASDDISSGFLRDVLSDASGYSFHRFQIFAWTLVLGVIFISSVYNELTMPEFSATLLGLMGISSGTYIGFKFPEEK
jgi:chaperonin cofactor prefoldin